jgi:hypothetical protein
LEKGWMLKGLTKEQLIDEMGIPVRQYKSDNFEIIEYYQSATGYTPRISTSNVVGVVFIQLHQEALMKWIAS